MKSDVQVVVVGGGIAGASLLYWLAKKGWTDTVLVERRELTSGSTWHSSGQVAYFGPQEEYTRLYTSSIQTYIQAEQESGQSISFHQPGSLRLASSKEELERFKIHKPDFDQRGIPYKVCTPNEVSTLHPLLEVSDIFGAAHTTTDGFVDPSGTTNALAKAARGMGASVERFCPVISLQSNANGWLVETEKGNISTKHVVVATSFWARELLAELGINVPVFAIKHQCILSESLPGLVELDREVPVFRDSGLSGSARQEGKGILAGFYEDTPEFWGLDGIPKDFHEDLFDPELDRIMPNLEKLMHRLPSLRDAGIKNVINGPLCMTPDTLPLIGPVRDHKGLWLAAGFHVGIAVGGGSGEFLAHWMTTGAPLFDLKAVHADRFGNDMSNELGLELVKQNYNKFYQLPNQTRNL